MVGSLKSGASLQIIRPQANHVQETIIKLSVKQQIISFFLPFLFFFYLLTMNTNEQRSYTQLIINPCLN